MEDWRALLLRASASGLAQPSDTNNIHSRTTVKDSKTASILHHRQNHPTFNQTAPSFGHNELEPEDELHATRRELQPEEELWWAVFGRGAGGGTKGQR